MAERDYTAVQERHERTVADEWREAPFAQLLVEPVRNGIYKRKEFHGRGVKVVNMGELFANPRLRDVHMRRVELSESEQLRHSVKAGDLLFARRSLVAEGAGKCSVVLEINEPTAFESSIIRARPDPRKADSLFIYYYFNSPIGLHALDTIRRQVAVAGITGTDLVQLHVRVPPLPKQRAIAQVLGTLDDKIELNRRMNETLEGMARALFKSWFVDFEPVRAKMEGRWRRGKSLPGLPAELYDLLTGAVGGVGGGGGAGGVGGEWVVDSVAGGSGGHYAKHQGYSATDGSALPVTQDRWATPKAYLWRGFLSSTRASSDTVRGTRSRTLVLDKIGLGTPPTWISVLLSSKEHSIGYLCKVSVGAGSYQPVASSASCRMRECRTCSCSTGARRSTRRCVNHANGSTFLEISKGNI